MQITLGSVHICLIGLRQHRLFTRTKLDKHLAAAAEVAPSIGRKKITCHSLRHSRAMHLFEAGVNLIYIRDIFDHASVTTTEIYAKTNPELIPGLAMRVDAIRLSGFARALLPADVVEPL